MHNKKSHLASFSPRLGQLLQKMSDPATVAVAHDSIRSILMEYQLVEILSPLLAQLDYIQRLNERQRKEYSRIYLTVIQVYEKQLQSKSLLQRLVDSLAKKSFFVGEAVGHLCKVRIELFRYGCIVQCVISKMEAQDTASKWVRHFIDFFRNNQEYGKVLMEIIDNCDENIVCEMQNPIIGRILEKIATQKHKASYLNVVHKLILALEEKFVCENQMALTVLKCLESEDWQSRKLCVDLCCDLLTIKKEANAGLHNSILKLKYDRIKHVRDSVINYQHLYKDQTSVKNKGEYVSRTQKVSMGKPSLRPSLKKTLKGSSPQMKMSQANSNFFDCQNNTKKNNRMTYSKHSKYNSPAKEIQNRNSMQSMHSIYIESEKKLLQKVKSAHNFNYDKPIVFVPIQQMQIKILKKETDILPTQRIQMQPTSDKQLIQMISQLRYQFQSMQVRVFQSLTNLQQRIVQLQTISRRTIEQKEVSASGAKEVSNLDAAFRAALTSKNKTDLLKLLADELIPTDSVIEDCLLLEIRKILNDTSVLKWLKCYLMDKRQLSNRLEKILLELQQQKTNEDSNNELLKQMVLNQYYYVKKNTPK